jgi:hypothetical protein
VAIRKVSVPKKNTKRARDRIDLQAFALDIRQLRALDCCSALNLRAQHLSPLLQQYIESGGLPLCWWVALLIALHTSYGRAGRSQLLAAA